MKRDRINSLLVAVWLALFGIVNIYMSFTGISEIRGRALVVYIPIVFLMFSVLSREKINLNYKYFCAFFLYSISIVLSCLLNQVFDIRTILPIFIGLFLLLFVFLNLKLDLHRMLELFAVLVVVGIVLIITNVYINGIDFFSANYFLDTRINYYTDVNTSIFENKNTWGMVLTSCFIANRYCLIVCKDKFKRFLFITQVLFFLAILFSGARSSVLVCIIFEIIRTALSGEYRILKFILSVITIFGIFYFFYYMDVPFISRFFLKNDVTISGRLPMVKAGLNLWLEKPVLGFGIGKEDMLLKQLGFRVGSTHNNYVDWLIEGGILYLGANLYILFLSLKKAMNIFKKNVYIGAFHIAAVCGYMTYSLVEYMKLFLPSINGIYLAFVTVYSVFMYNDSIFFQRDERKE
jgi:O-antigen ligase